MAVVDLVGVVGDVAEAKNAMGAVDGGHRSSDGEVRLSNHVHGWIVRSSSKFVGEVRFCEVLCVIGGDEGIEVPGLGIRPMIEVLLEVNRRS